MIDYGAIAKHHEGPVMVLDCNAIATQYAALQKALPTVDFYYAIKALSHEAVIRTIDNLGGYFDIATSGEIALLKKQWIAPQRTLHTHPIKTDAEIRKALRFGCTSFVIDNPYELEKFVKYRHRVRLLIRLSFTNAHATVDLSKKFGCDPKQALWLLQRAKQLGLTVKGFSFHAGSQAKNSDNHVKAITACKDLIVQAQALGHTLSILNIGGGFPVTYDESVPTINTFCKPINQALQTLPKHIQIIAEPGRFLVASAMTAVCQVIGKARRGDHTWYYLNDGVYGAFSGQLYDHARYPITTLQDAHEPTYTSVLAGPTCDSIDVIAENIMLPELHLGDIVLGHQMGAYTLASATEFNGIPKPKVLAVNALSGQITWQEQK